MDAAGTVSAGARNATKIAGDASAATGTATNGSASQGAVPGTAGDAGRKTEEANAETNGTAGSVTAKQASLVTPLDSAVQDEEYFANQSKQQIALMQQHQAVQHFDASKYYSKINNMELAELELRSAIMYMPNLKIAHRDYCLVAFMRGKPMRAFAEFLMVLGLCEPIPLSEEQQRDLRIEAAQAHYKRGVEQAQKSDWNEAISELFAYASKGDFKRAEEYYQSTFSIDPSDAFAHADFAYLLDKNGKKDEAMAEMSKAVKVDPDSTALHVDLGWLAQSKGDLAKAETEFRAALKNSPQYSSLWYQLGQLLEKKGDKAEARIAYVTALKKEPSNSDAKTALASLDGAGNVGAVTEPKPAADTSKQTKL
jgi:tetratricopeptide (TPR) repeat protein